MKFIQGQIALLLDITIPHLAKNATTFYVKSKINPANANITATHTAMSNLSIIYPFF